VTGVECVADARTVRVGDRAEIAPARVGKPLLEGRGNTVRRIEEQDFRLSIPVKISEDRFTPDV
jgi:hypothetical protein